MSNPTTDVQDATQSEATDASLPRSLPILEIPTALRMEQPSVTLEPPALEQAAAPTAEVHYEHGLGATLRRAAERVSGTLRGRFVRTRRVVLALGMCAAALGFTSFSGHAEGNDTKVAARTPRAIAARSSTPAPLVPDRATSALPPPPAAPAATAPAAPASTASPVHAAGPRRFVHGHPRPAAPSHKAVAGKPVKKHRRAG